MTGKLSDIDLIAHALKLAPESADHAEEVLEFFCDDVARTATDIADVDPRILSYLATCFRRILDGYDPKEALNLDHRDEGKRRERTDEATALRNFRMARSVVRRMRHGQLRDEAYLDVAEEYGFSDSTVKKAYELYGQKIREQRWD